MRKTCHECGDEFETLQDREDVRFCCRACGQLWYKAHGQYAIQKECETCGKPMITSRFKPSKNCNKKCAAAWRIQRGLQWGKPKS